MRVSIGSINILHEGGRATSVEIILSRPESRSVAKCMSIIDNSLSVDAKAEDMGIEVDFHLDPDGIREMANMDDIVYAVKGAYRFARLTEGIRRDLFTQSI